MKKLVAAAFAAAAALSFAPEAQAAEALLIRHEVLSVPVGTRLELQPGFFIGQARTIDPAVADASLDTKLRTVRFTATAPGRTIISTYSLREPNKRIEYEIVVVDAGMDAWTSARSVERGDRGLDADDVVEDAGRDVGE